MVVLRIATLVFALTYLGWRLAFTWDGANPVLFFLLVAAEAFGMLRLWMEISLLGDPRPENRTPETGMAPDADVVVVVVDEPASEVRAAVLSARLIRGYGKLVIVDRDDRLDVGELARRLEIERVAGSVDSDLGELIGTALDRCQSLLTLLVPADVVVMPDILEVSSGAFADPEVGVVVSRVEDTNAANSVDFGGYGEHRRRDTLMLDKLDTNNALPWWSGMAVVRRAAVQNVGGMARGRFGVTLSTGVRLQADGWKITDVPVVVARRLAPWSDDRHLHRWARELHERLAVLVDPEAPRRGEHSTRMSRRVYRTADIHVGRAIQRLVLVGVLLTTMYTSSLPLVADPVVLALLWGAWMGSSMLLRRQATAPLGFTPWITNDLRLLATDLAVAVRALSGRDLQSELGEPAPGRKARTVLLIGLQVVIAATLAGFGLGILRPTHGDFATFVTLWFSAWLWVMVLRARSALKLRQVRRSFRTFEQLDVFASESKMGISGVSPFGVDVVSAAQLTVGQKVRLAFGLPQADGSVVRIECSTSVRRAARDGKHHVAYLRFAPLDDEQMDRITEYLSVVAGHRMLRDTDGGIDAVPGLAEVIPDHDTTDDVEVAETS